MQTFRNPVSPFDAPDPFMTWDGVTGYYYSLFTRGSRLELFRSRHAANIVTDVDSRILFLADGKNGIFGDIWAPEMHRAPNGKWYIYTSGRVTPEPGEKRLFIMESETEDPFGAWNFRGLPAPNLFAIDPTVYTDEDGRQYICYSRVDREYGQVLDIRELVTPFTFGEKTVMIAKAEYDWELVPPYDKSRINEGAFFVKRGKRLYILYSGNGCWSDDYCLGLLEHTGGDLLSADNWKKHEVPVFTKGNGVYGPGHASFFASPDGTEVWCAYHGMKEHNEHAVCAPRYFNIQKMTFDEQDFPVPATAVGYETDLVPPSGEKY
ncbi:MAG: glycoside hydrolase family 43 protein [Clostridia bacterium]|nr:glycoside hydrolase family 43 protein [Clostridia bacterium]